LGEYERSGDDVADLGWAGGDALEGAPAGGEQGEAAFSDGASRAVQRKVWLSTPSTFPSRGRLIGVRTP
jgi:hypothetical protein